MEFEEEDLQESADPPVSAAPWVHVAPPACLAVPNTSTILPKRSHFYLVASFPGKDVLPYPFSCSPTFPHIFNFSSQMSLNKAVNLKLVQTVSIISLGGSSFLFYTLEKNQKWRSITLKKMFMTKNTHYR